MNITLGLPIIRTSVDHGTAFDIAGKGIANELSLIEAIDYAERLAAARLAAGVRKGIESDERAPAPDRAASARRSIEFGPGTAPRPAAGPRPRAAGGPLVVADAFNAQRVACPGAPGRGRPSSARSSPSPACPISSGCWRRPRRPGRTSSSASAAAAPWTSPSSRPSCPGSGQTIADVVGPERVNGRSCALVQVPTTSGTGSEAGTRALVTDPATRNKLAVQSRHMLADLAVVDPELTLTVPRAVTAATGVDALAHCAEAFTSRKAHPVDRPSTRWRASAWSAAI